MNTKPNLVRFVSIAVLFSPAWAMPPPQAGLLVHLDSRGAGTTNGQKVSTWPDSSGNGHSAVSTVQPSNATYRLYPEFAAPLVSFAPTYNPLKIAAIVDDFDEFTVAFSLRPRTLQSYNQRLGTSQSWGNGFLFQTATGGSVYVGTDVPTRMDPAVLPAGTLKTNVLQFFTFTYSAGVGRFYRDGQLLFEKAGMKQSNAAAWGTASGLRIGTLVDGDHGDVFVYSRALSKNEVVDLQDYHETKFQLTLDSDGDGFADRSEFRIINAIENDGIDSLASVLPNHDFDGDGAGNLLELMQSTDPTDPSSFSLFPNSGVRLWLDSRDIAELPGQPITQWPDRSGNGTFAILANPAYLATLSQIPGSNAPMVRFQGGIDHFHIPGLGGKPGAYSVSWSTVPKTLYNYNQALGTPWGGAFKFHASANGGVYVGSNVSSRLEPTQLPAGTMIPNVLQVFTYTFENGTGRLFRDGKLLGQKSGLAAPGSWTPFRIGQNADCEVGEVIIHERALNPYELLRLAEGIYHKLFGSSSPDLDFDGIPDWWEKLQGLNSSDPIDGGFDPDGDGLSNLSEFENSTNPGNADSDGDGITDGGEVDEGTNPNNADDTPDAEWVVATSDDQDQVVTKRRVITLKPGETRIVVIGVQSDEFDEFTGQQSQWNDILTWKVKATGHVSRTGNINVNSRHAHWHAAELAETMLNGFSPAHLETTTVFQAPANAPLEIEVELTATNVDDSAYASTVIVGLLPVELAFDANRDGEITFDGEDRTTAEKPFRFWINNDQDDVEADEPVIVTNPDSSDGVIATKRDLEDLTRIKISVGLPLDQLKNGSWQAGLKFKNTGGQVPSIRLWPNESALGSDDYLNDGTTAARQIVKQTFGKTTGGTIFIPQSYWQERTNTEAHLIFEGINKGIGEVTLILKNRSQGSEVESAAAHLKLLDVREMFQRARIEKSGSEIPNPWVDDTPPAQTWVWDPWNWPYDEDQEAAKITAIYVHGWRLSYNEYLTWSQSSYKRLWHQGFKGKFYTFRWSTLSSDQSNFEGYLTYNPSEYRAWLCGPALASWVNSLPNAGRRSLFAHSMGNVISGAALRSGMSVQRYALCNAAMASMAYDSGPHLKLNPDDRQPWDEIWGNFGPRKTPDTDPSATVRNRHGLENKFNDSGNLPDMINFYLRDDEALKSWINNNRFFKPDASANSYYYQETPIAPNLSYKLFRAPLVGNPREVKSQSEALGYVTKALTRTAGSDPRTGGSIDSSVDMNDWGVGAKHSGFGETHSAAWRWSLQSTNLFWERLCVELILLEQ